MTVAEFEARFNELSEYVPDLVTTDLEQSTFFERALRTEIRKSMSISSRDTFEEVVQSALRAE